MAKKKAVAEVEPMVVAKCDSLYEVTYCQSDIERNFRFHPKKDEVEVLKSQIATSSWGSHIL